MLGLQVGAPLHLVVELVIILLQDLHRVGITDPAKVAGRHVLQTLLQPLVHEAVEELDLLRAALQHPADDVLDHGLGHIHVTGQVAEGHLRLDHPELGGVALGVGVLGPEGGAEGIHIAEGHGEVLGVQLAGHRQAGFLTEEVLGVVHLPVLGLGDVVQIQGGHLEHLAGALAVAAGDDGGLYIHETPALEELMHCVGRHGAYPERGGEQVGTGPQVLDGPQEFHAVTLLLQGVIRRGLSLYLDAVGLHLQRLLGIRRQHHGALDDQRRAHVLCGDILIVGQLLGGHDHLQVLEAGAVVQLDEAKGLHVADGACPAAHGHVLAAQGLLIGEDRGNSHSFHIILTFSMFFCVAFRSRFDSTLYYKPTRRDLQGRLLTCRRRS